MSIQPEHNSKAWVRALRSPWTALLAWTTLLGLIVVGLWAPETSDDGHAHANWLHYYTDQVLGGDLSPRWLTEANAGLGSPAFFYYPPLPYWTASLLALVTTSADGGWLLLMMSVVLALGLSGATCFVWLREQCGQSPALLAAMLYTVMPYHLATDVFVRGALAELWGFVWMPLLLHLVARLAQGSRRAAGGLTLAYAGLLCSHPPTALIFSIVLPVYLWLKSAQGTRARALLQLAGSTGLGFGLAAFYLVPALTLRELVFVEAMGVGRMADYLFEPGVGGLPALRGRVASSVSHAVLTLLAICAICSTAALRQSNAPDKRREAKMWLLVGAAVLFCTTPFSQFVWDNVPLIKTIQFAWRLTSILCLATAALVGMALGSAWTATRPGKFFAATLFLATLGVWAAMLPAEAGFAIKSKSRTQPDVPHLSEVAEYFPKPGPRDLPTTLERLQLPARHNRPLPRLEPAGTLEVERWRARRLQLTVSTQQASALKVLQFRYPGWKARVNGQEVPLLPNPPDDMILFEVPEGESKVEVLLPLLPEERTGYAVSAVSLSLLLLFGWFGRRITKAELPNPSEDGEP